MKAISRKVADRLLKNYSELNAGSYESTEIIKQLVRYSPREPTWGELELLSGIGQKYYDEHIKWLQDQIRIFFNYSDGQLKHAFSLTNPNSMQRAGYFLKNGYRNLKFEECIYPEHYLIYLYHHNIPLGKTVYHIVTGFYDETEDNRIENLELRWK